MKTFISLAIFLATAVPALAEPHVFADKQFAQERQAVADALFWMSVGDSDWSIFVIPEKEWKDALRNGQRGHTAYTLRGTKLTYVNAAWVKNIHGDPRQIAPTLAHEYGHILCNCTEEGRAEGYVSILFHRR